MIFLITLFLAIGLSLCLTPLAGQIGHRFGLVDVPGGRRQHKGIIPRTGGVALAAAFCITTLLVALLPMFLPPTLAAWFPPHNDVNEMRKLTALLVGCLFCATVGLLDDHYDFSSGPQYLFQLLAGFIAILGLIFIKDVNNPFGEGLLFGPDGFPWWLVWLGTIIWFMGTMTTVNFLDGLNGLATGVTSILSIVLAIYMIFQAEPPQLSVALLPVALLGVTIGFLPYNLPAHIFMGSSGSYFLGFAVAALGIIGGAKLATVMLVLGLPALDVAWLILTRWRRGVSPNQGGRDHLHFRLLDAGLSERTIVFGYWGFCAVFGALTLLVDERLYKLIALGGLGFLAMGVLIWASHTQKA